jgi:hypothetical protein
VRIPRITLRSLMVGIVISSFLLLAVRELGWAFTSFCTLMIVIPSIGISAWQKLAIQGVVVGALMSASCFLSLTFVPLGLAPVFGVLAAMMLWWFAQSVQPVSRLQTLIRHAMWGTISFNASLLLSLICIVFLAYAVG